MRPNDYNRYLLRLDMVNGKKRTGARRRCRVCWGVGGWVGGGALLHVVTLIETRTCFNRDKYLT